jgi:Nif-specific regulatory protein
LWNGSRETAGAGLHPPSFTPLPIVSKSSPPPVVRPPVRPVEEPAPSAAAPVACPGAENCSVAEGGDQRSDREKLIEAMEQAGWVKAKAARLLGLTPRQIGYALQKHEIPVKKF